MIQWKTAPHQLPSSRRGDIVSSALIHSGNLVRTCRTVITVVETETKAEQEHVLSFHVITTRPSPRKSPTSTC